MLKPLFACLAGAITIFPLPSSARTFTPASFSSPYVTRVIPKFTEKVAQDSLGGGVFAGMGPSVIYTLEDCGKYVRFTVDPYRSRIVFSRNDVTSGSGAFGARGAGNGAFVNPQDIDIYVDKTLAIADAGNNRVVFMDWADNMIIQTGAEPHCQIADPNQGAIIPVFLWNVGPAEGFNFLKPSGVSVDDRGTPQTVSDDVLWVADTGNNRICLVRVDTYNGTMQSLGSYGSFGSGVGQFNLPLRAVRGRVAVNGDSTSSRNNSDLFVLDRGNRRIVKLHCDSLGTAANISWVSTVVVPSSPLLESIATDAWGNVYVTDSRNHHVLKYSQDLEWLASYGQFGTGVMVGEMRKPSDFRPQFRLDYSVSPPRPVATPFAILTESWSDSTGGQGCLLGIEAQVLSTSTAQNSQRLDFKLTDHAFTRIEVIDGAGQVLRLLDSGITFRKSGTNSVVWDGRRTDGTPAQLCQTYRFRLTPRTGYSAVFDSSEIKTTDFDFSPKNPLTYRVVANVPGATIIDNGNRVVLPGPGYAVVCSTCTSGATRTLSTDPTQNISSLHYCFDRWSNGGGRTQTISLNRDSTITLYLVSSSGPTTVPLNGVLYDDAYDCKSPYLFQGSATLSTSSPTDTFRTWGDIKFRFPKATGSQTRASLSIIRPFKASGVSFETVDSTATTTDNLWAGLRLNQNGSVFLTGCSIRNADFGIGNSDACFPPPTVSVQGSSFEWNRSSDINVWLDPARSATANLVANTFNAAKAVQLAMASPSSGPVGTATITDNSFNSAPTQGFGALDLKGGWQGSVLRNTFTVSPVGALGLSLTQGPASCVWPPGASGSPSVVIWNNKFIAIAGRNYALRTAFGPVLQTDARVNDWNNYTTASIASVIIDRADEAGRAEALYQPFITPPGGGGGGGCPFVLSETDSGFVVENTLLGNSELATSPGGLVSDSYELHRARPDMNGIVRLRIAELETETDEIDRVALGSVLLDEGEEVGTAPDGNPVVYRAVDHTLTRRSWTGSRGPFISPIAPMDAYRGEPGDSLELQVGGRVNAIPGGSWRRGIGISLIPKPQAPPMPNRGSVGIALRVSPDSNGDRWFTVDFIPRENWSTAVVPLEFLDGKSVQRMRLIWNSAHTLGWVGEVETKPLPDPQMLPCAVARHSDGTAVTAQLAEEDAQRIILKPGEHVDLEFDAKGSPLGGRLVLFAHGRYTHAGGPEIALVPKAYSVSQNHPNPFNPETSIELRLPQQSHVTVRIFDVSGRLVTELVDGSMPAGIHTVRWNGRDQEGTPQASGVYFYEVRANQFSRRLRMVLLR